MRTATDVKVTKDVNVSRALYNNDREKAQSAARVMQRALDILRNHLDLPTDLKVRVCTFRKSTIGGVYSNYEHTAGVTLRSYRGMISSLAHELVHAEQYHQNRLSHNGSVYMWNGSTVNNKRTTYNAYRNRGK